MLKYLLIISLCILFIGCGEGEPVHAADPFPTMTVLTCTGQPDIGGGQICDESDGQTWYRHDQFAVTYRPDGHGAFRITTETGVRRSGLVQVPFRFPTGVQIVELHGTLAITSWCGGNGALSAWDAQSGALSFPLVGGKTFQFASRETTSWTMPQIVFPVPVGVETLVSNNYTDLCAQATYHWVLEGSF